MHSFRNDILGLAGAQLSHGPAPWHAHAAVLNSCLSAQRPCYWVQSDFSLSVLELQWSLTECLIYSSNLLDFLSFCIQFLSFQLFLWILPTQVNVQGSYLIPLRLPCFFQLLQQGHTMLQNFMFTFSPHLYQTSALEKEKIFFFCYFLLFFSFVSFVWPIYWQGLFSLWITHYT